MLFLLGIEYLWIPLNTFTSWSFDLLIFPMELRGLHTPSYPTHPETLGEQVFEVNTCMTSWVCFVRGEIFRGLFLACLRASHMLLLNYSLGIYCASFPHNLSPSTRYQLRPFSLSFLFLFPQGRQMLLFEQSPRTFSEPSRQMAQTELRFAKLWRMATRALWFQGGALVFLLSRNVLYWFG